MKKIRPTILAGPNPSSGAARCWNIASVSEEEGEIVLYGDVVSQQPVDWWTGEPEPGLFITPEGFMQDLETVRGKSKVTVKLNSCGGDLYTGIAIHNAIKALGAHVDVVVEGIAASAASVIAMAGISPPVTTKSPALAWGVDAVRGVSPRGFGAVDAPSSAYAEAASRNAVTIATISTAANLPTLIFVSTLLITYPLQNAPGT